MKQSLLPGDLTHMEDENEPAPESNYSPFENTPPMELGWLFILGLLVLALIRMLA